MTRNSPLRARGAHISLVCHITAEELRRHLTETEMASGFANRFLFPWVQRSQKLPHGSEPDPDDTAAVVEKLHSILIAAKTITRMHRSPEATVMWGEVYNAIDDEVTGLISYLGARAEAQMLRLSIVYALLDASAVIQPPHVAAAAAVWNTT